MIRMGSHKLSQSELHKRIINKLTNDQFNRLINEIINDLDQEKNSPKDIRAVLKKRRT